MSSALVTAGPPGDSSGDAQLAAKTAYNNALVKLNNQRQGVLRNYGYTAKFDPTTGQVNGVSVDPNNPYGQLQTTLNQQAGEDTQATNDSVGRGIHGGLAHQAESSLQYAHHGQTSALAGNLMGTLDDLTGQQAAAGDTYNNTLYQAQLDATRNAIMQQMFNTPDYGGTQDSAPPDATNTLGYGFTQEGVNNGAGINQAAWDKWVTQQHPQANTGSVMTKLVNPTKAKVVKKVIAGGKSKIA